VVRDIRPTVAVCQDLTGELNESGEFILNPRGIDGGSSDNCGSVQLDSEVFFYCNRVCENLVTLTVTDAYDNVAKCKAMVTIEDNFLPKPSKC